MKHSKFPALSAEVSRLKETEGGAQAVCEVMEKYEKIAVDEALKKERIHRIQIMIRKGKMKEEMLELGYTIEDISEAEKQLLQKV